MCQQDICEFYIRLWRHFVLKVGREIELGRAWELWVDVVDIKVGGWVGWRIL